MRAIVFATFFSFVLCSLGFNSQASASLMGRPQHLSTGLLPAKVWIVSFEYGASSPINRTYNSNSQSESLSASLSKTLTIADVVNGITDPTERGLSEAAFEKYGLKPSTQAGTVTNDLNIRYSSQAYVLGYGAAEFLSVFFVAPKINVKLDLETSLEYSADVNRMVAKLREEGQITRADAIEQKRATVLGDQLSNYNYDPNYISEYEGIPSFHLVARAANKWMRRNGFSSETMLTIPNKQDRYVDQFTPLEFFEESLSVTQSLKYSLQLFDQVQFDNSVSYRLRTPYEREMRVPESSEIAFSNDKRSVSGKDGDEWSIGTQISRPTSFLTPFAGVIHTQKFRDQYEAAEVEPSRFDSLTGKSAQALSVMTFGANFNTIEMFSREKFILPLQLGLMYSKTIGGTNTFENEVYAANLMVFYR